MYKSDYRNRDKILKCPPSIRKHGALAEIASIVETPLQLSDLPSRTSVRETLNELRAGCEYTDLTCPALLWGYPVSPQLRLSDY